MRKILPLIIYLLTISCNDKNGKPTVQENENQLVQAQEPTYKSSDRPTRNFETVIRMLDSLGYKSDTVRVARLKIYKELHGCEVQLFGTFPFYKMDKEKSKVLRWNTIAHSKEDSINTEIFKEAESVWSYFYQKEERKNIMTDGVIEQWTFSDTVKAQIALDKLKEIYPLPYFNTQPYYVRDGQFLFIFHTRADAFSYRQREFFNRFLEISSTY